MSNPEYDSIISRILNLIPKGNVSRKSLIQSYEKVQLECKNKEKVLYELSKYCYKKQDKKVFEKLNHYFKKVHGAIKLEVKKSKLLDVFLEKVVLMNYKNSDTYEYRISALFTVAQGRAAYLETMNHYDPNIKQSKRNKHFKWNGYWTLVKTKKGVITNLSFSASENNEYPPNDQYLLNGEFFYNALEQVGAVILIRESKEQIEKYISKLKTI